MESATIWRNGVAGLVLVILSCHGLAVQKSFNPNDCSSTTNDSRCDTDGSVEKRSLSRHRQIIISTVLEPPYMMLKENSAFLAGSERFEGYLADILRQVALNVGFQYEIRLSRDGKYGERKTNGEWDGVIGEIISGSADIAAAAFVVTDELRDFVDFTEPFLSLRSSAVLLRPSPAGNLTSSNQRYFVRPIATSEQLFHSNIPYGVVAGSLTHRMMSTSSDPMIRKAWQRMKQFSPPTFVRTTHEGIDRIKREPYAFILDTPMAEYVSGRPPCDLYATEPFLDVMHYAFAVRRQRSQKPPARYREKRHGVISDEKIYTKFERQKQTDRQSNSNTETVDNSKPDPEVHGHPTSSIHKARLKQKNISRFDEDHKVLHNRRSKIRNLRKFQRWDNQAYITNKNVKKSNDKIRRRKRSSIPLITNYPSTPQLVSNVNRKDGLTLHILCREIVNNSSSGRLSPVGEYSTFSVNKVDTDQRVVKNRTRNLTNTLANNEQSRISLNSYEIHSNADKRQSKFGTRKKENRIRRDANSDREEIHETTAQKSNRHTDASDQEERRRKGERGGRQMAPGRQSKSANFDNGAQNYHEENVDDRDALIPQGDEEFVPNLKEKINRELMRMMLSGELQEMYLRWWKDDCRSSTDSKSSGRSKGETQNKDNARGRTTPSVHRRYASYETSSGYSLYMHMSCTRIRINISLVALGIYLCNLHVKQYRDVR